MRPNTWQVLLGIGLPLTASYVALPYGLLASRLYVLATAGAAVAVGFAVLRRPRPFAATAWGLIAIAIAIALALALAAIGHGIWYWLDRHGREPFRSAADVFYLAVCPLSAVALWQLGVQTARDNGATWKNR